MRFSAYALAHLCGGAQRYEAGSSCPAALFASAWMLLVINGCKALKDVIAMEVRSLMYIINKLIE